MSVLTLPSLQRIVFSSVLITTLFSYAIDAQQLLVYGANALPNCAQQCTLLTQAQSACVPPAAPVTDQTIYESCFCQSGYLTSLKTDPSAICGSACSGTDLAQIGTWYSSNCVNDGANVAATATTSSTSKTADATTIPSSTSGTASTGSSTGNTGIGGTSVTATKSGSWWSNHWKWILMLILIFVLVALLAVIGILIRRRHRKNRDKNTRRFNDGITTRTTPMATAPGSRATNHPPNTTNGFSDGRATPMSYGGQQEGPGPYGYGAAMSGGRTRSESLVGSMNNLSRVRERDRNMTTGRGPGGVGSDYTEQVRRAKSATPDAERGSGLLKKGKGRLQPGEDAGGIEE